MHACVHIHVHAYIGVCAHVRVLYKGRDPGIYPDLLPSELNIHYIKEGNIKTSIMKSTKVQTLGTI